MATLTSVWPTFIDLAKTTKDNLILRSVDTIVQRNDIIAHVPWLEANGMTGHTYNRVLSHPSVSWTGLNEGVTATQGTTEQRVADIKIVESLSEVPEKTLNIAPDPGAFRSNRDMYHVGAMANAWADKYFNGDSSSDPKEPDGLANIMNATSTSGPYVLDNGGSATLSSIYAVDWGDGKNYAVHPRNHAAKGLQIEQRGKYKQLDDNSKHIWVWGTSFALYSAFVNEHPETLGRLANINTASGGAGDFDEDALMELLSYFDDLSTVALYSNRALHYQISLAAKDKSNVSYGPNEAFGQTNVLQFQGVPLFRCDAISSAETAIS